MPMFTKSICTFLFAGLALFSKAQPGDYYLGNTRYSFISYESNTLQLPADTTRFNRFFSLLDTLILQGQGQLNIVHFGGSHIQADIYTHLIRQRLLDLSLSGGRGLVFPYDVAETNNPWNYSDRFTGSWETCKCTRPADSCTLGVMGIAVTTRSPRASVTIEVEDNFPLTFRFNRLRIFHEPSPYLLRVVSGSDTLLGTCRLTQGYTEFQLPDEVYRFTLLVQRDSVPAAFTLQGISLENDRPGIRYNAIGVNGAKLSSYLRCTLFTPQLAEIDPQLVIFSIGTNDGYTRTFSDSLYQAEYRQLLDSTLKAVPEAAILLTVPNDSYLYKEAPNKNTEAMRRVIYRLAGEYHCAVWDFYTVMGGFNSSQDWYSLGLMKNDRVHFTREGYRLKGELFFSALLKAWEGALRPLEIPESIPSLQPSSE